MVSLTQISPPEPCAHLSAPPYAPASCPTNRISFYASTASCGPLLPLWGPLINIRDTPHSRTHLDEWSTRRRDLYLPAQNTRYSQTSMPPAEFQPAVPASERPHVHALDRADTGIGTNRNNYGDFEELAGNFQHLAMVCAHYLIQPHMEISCLSACFSSKYTIWRALKVLLIQIFTNLAETC